LLMFVRIVTVGHEMQARGARDMRFSIKTERWLR
jgi:hypothetical protein